MKYASARLAVFICFILFTATNVSAALVTFDDVITGQTSYGFDGDGDAVNDVIFSTTDPYGFNTIGPGTNMTYIDEPGLEGTSLLNPDLRVDFLVGAKNSISFGFALNSSTEDDTASISLFDSSDNLLGSMTVVGQYTLPNGISPSSYPEGYISLAFSGTAAYGLFNFTSDYGRYIIDNFEGTFGTTEVPVPEPASLALLSIGLLGLGLGKRKKI